MAAVAGILNHQMTAGQALGGRSAVPMGAASNGASSTGGSSGNSATISANDFLTLLVTEMKNQDPTATTDPNEYINQLVNVNSLQQLIAINQTLSSSLTAPATGSTQNAAASKATDAVKGLHGAAGQAQQIPAAAAAPGNLSVPAANQAASRVAQSLSGRSRIE